MQEKRNKLLADFNRLYKEEDELYHKAASKMMCYPYKMYAVLSCFFLK